jgi:hypothetical protein
MDDTSTQNDLIEAHLRAGRTITPIEALNNYGCFRLSGRIYDLKKKGLDIGKNTISNGKKQYAEYYLRSTLDSNGQYGLL